MADSVKKEDSVDNKVQDAQVEEGNKLINLLIYNRTRMVTTQVNRQESEKCVNQGSDILHWEIPW